MWAGARVRQGEAGQQPPERRPEGTYLSLSRGPGPKPRPESSPGPSRPDHSPGRGGGGVCASVSQPSRSRQRPQETLTGLCCAGLNGGGEDAHSYLRAGSQLEVVQCVGLQVL